MPITDPNNFRLIWHTSIIVKIHLFLGQACYIWVSEIAIPALYLLDLSFIFNKTFWSVNGEVEIYCLKQLQHWLWSTLTSDPISFQKMKEIDLVALVQCLWILLSHIILDYFVAANLLRSNFPNRYKAKSVKDWRSCSLILLRPRVKHIVNTKWCFKKDCFLGYTDIFLFPKLFFSSFSSDIKLFLDSHSNHVLSTMNWTDP